MQLHWTTNSGDPGLMAWVTVAAYLATAALCYCASTRARTYTGQSTWRGVSERQFWLGMALIFLVLGINKQLDLQTLFTEILRNLARSEGWYRNRRIYQLGFIGVLIFSAALFLLALLRLFRASPPAVKLALLGLTFTTTFVLLRAASFHHLDHFLRAGTLGWRWHWIMELGGIATVAVAALGYCRQPLTVNDQKNSDNPV